MSVGRNAAASPYRFELNVGPDTWLLEDDGYELAANGSIAPVILDLSLPNTT